MDETFSSMKIHSISSSDSTGDMVVHIQRSGSSTLFTKSHPPASMNVTCGPQHNAPASGHTENCLPSDSTENRLSSSEYMATEQHEDILARMVQSHKTGDICLVGEKVDHFFQC